MRRCLCVLAIAVLGLVACSPFNKAIPFADVTDRFPPELAHGLSDLTVLRRPVDWDEVCSAWDMPDLDFAGHTYVGVPVRAWSCRLEAHPIKAVLSERAHTLTVHVAVIESTDCGYPRRQVGLVWVAVKPLPEEFAVEARPRYR